MPAAHPEGSDPTSRLVLGDIRVGEASDGLAQAKVPCPHPTWALALDMRTRGVRVGPRPGHTSPLLLPPTGPGQGSVTLLPGAEAERDLCWAWNGERSFWDFPEVWQSVSLESWDS